MRPPRLAEWMLRSALEPDEHAPLLGDLAETFARLGASRGAGAAYAWYWREAFAALLILTGRRGAIRRGHGSHHMLSSLLSDLGHAIRVLRRAPAFTGLAVLTLGLGIGATTVITSVMRPTLLEPVRYPNADRLVMIWERDASAGASNTSFATLKDLRHATTTLAQVLAIGSWEPTVTGVGESERVAGSRVSAGYFRALGVHPAIGDDFHDEQDVPGSQRVVILSYGLWERRFGADRAIVGRTIDIEGIPHLVSGIMPRDFDDVLSPRAQIWRVLGYGPEQPWACRTCRHLRGMGLLAPRTSVSQAAAELDQIGKRLAAQYPTEYAAAGLVAAPLATEITKQSRPLILALFGATVMLLLIAVTNVASLQLTRALRREGEFAIRTALGAGRVQLARQLTAEGLVLGGLAGGVGALVARAALPLLLARLPATMPGLAAVQLDVGTMLLTGAIALVASIAIGVVPALRLDVRSLIESLRGGRRTTPGVRHAARDTVVVLEVAVSLMLLVGAALLARSVMRLVHVNGGFEPAHLLTMEVQATGSRYGSRADIWRSHENVVGAVRAVPGVVAAGTSSQLPLGGNFDTYGVVAEDRPLPNPELSPNADRYTITPGFLDAMGIRVLRGRALGEADNRDSVPRVVLISESLARTIWGTTDVLGRRVRIGGPTGPWREVVGITNDVRHHGLDNPRAWQIYIPDRQSLGSDDVVALAVRVRGDPAAAASAVAAAARSVDPTQPVMKLATMDAVIAQSLGERRLALVLFATFAGLAALLAGLGLYGVLASTVQERTREIGIRSALGAGPRQILSVVTRRCAAMTVAGGALGALGAFGLARFLTALIYGVQLTDPWTITSVAGAICLVAALAALGPALRAVRVDPIEAMRHE